MHLNSQSNHSHQQKNSNSPRDRVSYPTEVVDQKSRGLRYRCDIREKEDLRRKVELGIEASIKIDGICTYNNGGKITPGVNSILDILDSLEVIITGGLDGIETPLDREQLIKAVQEMKSGCRNFVLHLDDPRSESYIEALNVPDTDIRLRMEVYDPTADDTPCTKDQPPMPEEAQGQTDPGTSPKVVEICGVCPACSYEACCSRVCVTSIPHFDEVCIWSTSCDKCGYKNTEVTPSSPPKEQGTRITLSITDPEDFNRYVLQSAATKITVQEIGLEASLASKAGQFTTVEGVLKSLYELYESSVLASLQHDKSGSSEDQDDAAKAKVFLERFRKVANMEIIPLTFILDDPTSMAKIQNIHAPDEDPNMKTEYYPVTREET